LGQLAACIRLLPPATIYIDIIPPLLRWPSVKPPVIRHSNGTVMGIQPPDMSQQCISQAQGDAIAQHHAVLNGEEDGLSDIEALLNTLAIQQEEEDTAGSSGDDTPLPAVRVLQLAGDRWLRRQGGAAPYGSRPHKECCRRWL